MDKKSRKQNGTITVEFMVTFALIMILFLLLTETLIEIGRSNRIQWARQGCMAAAGAQLDSYAALGRPVDPDTFARLWPHVKVSIETEAGSGEWKGLTLVHVDAERRIDRKDIHIRQSRYIALPQEARP